MEEMKDSARPGDVKQAKSFWKMTFVHHLALGVCGMLLVIAVFWLIGRLGNDPVPPQILETDLYKDLLETVQGSDSVKEALGEPLDNGSFLRGEIRDGENDGAAKFNVVFKGPKGKGTLYVEASKCEGEWTYSLLELSPEGSISKISNLLLEAKQASDKKAAAAASVKISEVKTVETEPVVVKLETAPAPEKAVQAAPAQAK